MAKKPTLYKQCVLVLPFRNGHKRDVAWIPSQFAKVGRTLSIFQGGEWTDGWTVKEVGASQDFEYLDRQRDAGCFFRDKVDCKRDRRKEKVG